MSVYINKAIIMGNVGRDPDFHTTNDGKRIVTLSVATSENWKDKNGQRQEKTEWHRVVVMSEHYCDLIEKFISKGSRIYLEGQTRTNKWKDADGKDNFRTEIIIGRYNGEVIILDKTLTTEDDNANKGDEIPF